MFQCVIIANESAVLFCLDQGRMFSALFRSKLQLDDIEHNLI